MGSSEITIYVPALRAVGNILSTNDSRIIERCLWHGLIDKLTSMLYQSNSNIIKECLWAFSNITAGPGTHIEKFIQSAAFERIIFLTESKNIDHRKEAMWVLCNAITGADFNLRQ